MNRLIISITSLYIFFFSIYLLGIYTEGDYIDYSNAYEAILGKSYLQAFISYQGLIGSSEPIHFTISWIASNIGIDRILFVSLFNALTAFIFLKLGKKLNASLFILLLIVVTNFYFFALFTELERLKFGFLFFFSALYFIENRKLFIIFSIVTVLTHLQFLVIYAGFLAIYFLKQIKNILLNYRMEIKVLFFIAISISITVLMFDQLNAKFIYYYQQVQFLALLKVMPFVALILFYAQNKREVLVFIMPLLLMIFLIGGNRLIIFAYFIFLFNGIRYNRGLNFGIFVTSLYYFIGSIIFIFNIYEHGRGYGM